MSENSKIEWTDHTFNPWIGCTRVSPGCDHCYAAVSTPSRAMGVAWGPGEARHRTADSTWKQPRTWNNRHDAFYALHGRRQRVFCASLADVFDNAVPTQWRQELMSLIARTPNLDWLLLTKRIGNAARMLEEASQHDGLLMSADDHYHPLQNVWLGATIVNQEEADRDIPKLLAAPARVRFLSMEPLLGRVDLRLESRNDIARWDGLGRDLPLRRIDWVIAGGESGHGARPMHPEWAREIQSQCERAGVSFLFKQWGEYKPGSDFKYDERTIAVDTSGRIGGTTIDSYPEGASSADGWTLMRRVGKGVAGRLLDGRTHDEFPEGSCPNYQP